MFPFKSVCKVCWVFQSESANEIDSDFGYYPSNRDDSGTMLLLLKITEKFSYLKTLQNVLHKMEP